MKRLMIKLRNWLILKLAGNSTIVLNATIRGTVIGRSNSLIVNNQFHPPQVLG